MALLGIVGGLVPSGSALLLLLSAVALNEVLYGLLLIIAFGIGMGVILIAMSTGLVLLRRTPIMSGNDGVIHACMPLPIWLPTVSGLARRGTRRLAYR